MKIIDHVTKEETGEMAFSDFQVNDRFRIPLGDGQQLLYFIVTGVDYSGDGKLTVFEMNREQWERGLEIKDLLV